MKTALFMFSFLFSTSAFANFYYQPDTIIPLDLQQKIEAHTAANCDYEPHWRKIEKEGTYIHNGYMSIFFDVLEDEGSDLASEEPFRPRILVIAQSVNGVYELTNFSCF